MSQIGDLIRIYILMKRVPCILYPLHMPEIKEGGSKLPDTFPSGV